MQNLLLQAVDKFFTVIYVLILVRALMSWFPALRDTGFSRIVYELTEPLLGPSRQMLEKSPLGGGMMIDFSPIIALFIMKIVCVLLKYVIILIF